MRNVETDTNLAARGLKLLNETAKELKKGGQFDSRVEKLEQEVQLLRYALSNVFKTLADLPAIKSQLDSQEYRGLGILRALANRFENLPGGKEVWMAEVEEEAKASREEAFWELSNSDDETRKLIVADDQEIDEQSCIIITTEIKNTCDQGIFRSKMDVASKELEPYRESFLGKKTGDKVELKLYGTDHVATILGIRKQSSQQESDNADLKLQDPT